MGLTLARRVVIAILMLWLSIPAVAALPMSEALEIDRLVQSHPRQAAASAQALLQQASSKNDKGAQLRALRVLANAHTLLGNMVVLGEDLARGEQLARELNNPQAQVEFMLARGNDAELERQFTKADRRFADALAFSQKNQLPLGIATSYAATVTAALERGLKNNVVVYATKAYDLFESQGDLRGMAQMLTVLGLASVDAARSVAYLERAVDIIDTDVYRWDAGLVSYHLGAALFRSKNYKKAGIELRKALDAAVQLGVPVHAAYANYYLGRVALDERRFADAIGYWDQAIPVFTQNNDLPALFDIQRFRADALSALDRKTDSLLAMQAARSASQAVRALESKGKVAARSSRLQAPFNEYQAAYQEMLGSDSRTASGGGGIAATSSAEARFDAKLRETEYALLRERTKGAELERVTLVLALVGSVAILGLVALVLVRQIRQKRRFANLAMRDELTGLRNRRSILEFARVQFGTRTTLGTRLFIAILDLDHFKSVNDNFGHDIGDAVLIAFANACQRHLRSNHVFGRFGGEEFLLVMPDTREDQVFDIFERLREIVAELAVVGLPAQHELSFSMGAADARAECSSLEDLIKKADLALYRAKEKGRDRCEIHEGGLQALYDTNVVRARPTGHAPSAYAPVARLQSVKPLSDATASRQNES